MQSKVVNFKVSSAIKDLIGKELITDKNVAIFELVKNSFDADSSEISVEFNKTNNVISIRDNGCGMSDDEVINKWLFIGFSDKKNNSEKLYSGNKGIGRFSCDRIGQYLKLTSVKNKIKTSLLIDWNLFEADQNKEISNISIEVLSDITDEHNGTILEMYGLRDDWDVEDVRKVESQLKRLVSPNKNDVDVNLSIVFINENGTKTEHSNIKNDVFEYMQNKAIYISTIISGETIRINLFDSGNLVLSNTIKNTTLITSVDFKVFFASQSAKTIFKRQTGQEIVNYGNVFIYKNKFRIYPFGERGYDIFGIDIRKSQGHYRYLGSREIFGWIDITDYENHFLEATSRDHGFVENNYYIELRDAYYEFVHKPLESYVQLINYGNITLDNISYYSSPEVVIDELKRNFSFGNSSGVSVNESLISSKADKLSLRDLDQYDNMTVTQRKELLRDIRKKFKNNQAELIAVSEKNKKIIEDNDNLKNEIERKNRFINQTNPSRQKILEHDLQQVINRLNDSIDCLTNYHDSQNEEMYVECMTQIVMSVSRIAAIRNFLLKTNLDTRVKSKIELGAFIYEYVNESHKHESSLTIRTHVINDFSKVVNLFDIITIVENVISNAKNQNASKLDIFVNEGTILFSTDTYRVESNTDFSRVFDFGYTTTLGGTGMGLYIIKQICDEYNFTVSMFVENEKNVVLEMVDNEKKN